MYVYKIETSYIEDNFNGTSCQCCGNCQLWAPEQEIDYKINAADLDTTDTTVTTSPLNLGACIISRRTGKDGETCYLQTHRTSGTFCRYHIPTSPYAAHIKRHGLPCTAITPYIIHL